MPPSPPLLLLRFCFLLLCVTRPSSASTGLIGVAYRANNQFIQGRDIATTMQNLAVPRVRIIDPAPEDVSQFAGTGIIVNLSVENQNVLAGFSANKTAADSWVKSMLSGGPKVTSITLGYDLFAQRPELTDGLFTALKNTRAACDRLGFKNVAVTTAHSYSVISGVFPPSNSELSKGTLLQMMKLLPFLRDTKAPFQVEMYPYAVFKSRLVPEVTSKLARAEVDVHGDEVLVDPHSNYKYSNVLSMMIDSAVYALKKAGYGEIPVEVVGTGWPQPSPGTFDLQAKLLHSAEYNDRIITLFDGTGGGAPARPQQPTPVYLYSLIEDGPGINPVEPYKDSMGIVNLDFSMRYYIAWNATAMVDGGSNSGADGAQRRPREGVLFSLLSGCMWLLLVVLFLPG